MSVKQQVTSTHSALVLTASEFADTPRGLQTRDGCLQIGAIEFA